MTKKRGKPVSFDAMIKFFLKNYDIPTKKDIDRLTNRIERLERLIMTQQAVYGKKRVSGGSLKNRSRQSAMTAADRALEVIKRFKQGVGFADIQIRTGFDDKKLRNVIYRLNKLGKITSKSRGVYIAI